MKVYYFNDSKDPIAVSVNNLHSTKLVSPGKIFSGFLDIKEGEAMMVKKWEKVVLITTVPFDTPADA